MFQRLAYLHYHEACRREIVAIKRVLCLRQPAAKNEDGNGEREEDGAGLRRPETGVNARM